jgi:hypothetical protein
MKPFLVLVCCVLSFLVCPTHGAAQTASTATTQYVEVGGSRIAYRSIGSGSPLVLLTRMRGTLDTWDPLFLDQLAATVLSENSAALSPLCSTIVVVQHASHSLPPTHRTRAV